MAEARLLLAIDRATLEVALLAGDCRSQAPQRKAATMGVDHWGGAWMALWDLLEFVTMKLWSNKKQFAQGLT
jgi:hypothetical protein